MDEQTTVMNNEISLQRAISAHFQGLINQTLCLGQALFASRKLAIIKTSNVLIKKKKRTEKQRTAITVFHTGTLYEVEHCQNGSALRRTERLNLLQSD
ncbi:hypothetical protein DAPPUDRAFT_311934 [Daphnia pulex]|uniref:Uncharacterized protein n=1 Tax=Daphnia pulex TaxID=6669 RepID=E9FYD0_DAPPU|nr:hypothetical protein DAPPUDRAFT_311934 [Daphnia pulex]|eukprot:EFX87511.1 hypothetical protein DAPPUDRAFT_311934 [Daphnia pulex]